MHAQVSYWVISVIHSFVKVIVLMLWTRRDWNNQQLKEKIITDTSELWFDPCHKPVSGNKYESLTSWAPINLFLFLINRRWQSHYTRTTWKSSVSKTVTVKGLRVKKKIQQNPCAEQPESIQAYICRRYMLLHAVFPRKGKTFPVSFCTCTQACQAAILFCSCRSSDCLISQQQGWSLKSVVGLPCLPWRTKGNEPNWQHFVPVETSHGAPAQENLFKFKKQAESVLVRVLMYWMSQRP